MTRLDVSGSKASTLKPPAKRGLSAARRTGKPAYKNRTKTLVFASRNITSRDRHLMEDLRLLMPHQKQEAKLEKNNHFSVINEICELKVGLRERERKSEGVCVCVCVRFWLVGESVSESESESVSISLFWFAVCMNGVACSRACSRVLHRLPICRTATRACSSSLAKARISTYGPLSHRTVPLPSSWSPTVRVCGVLHRTLCVYCIVCVAWGSVVCVFAGVCW
jgi:hypothetical protein